MSDSISILLDSTRRMWPACVRIATTLGGTSGFAAVVSRQLLRRARPVCEQWIDEDEADRWFLHHTILLCRQTSNQPFMGHRDALISAFDSPSDEYIAFMRALRTLPFQQREAFVLNVCEKLDERLLAVAMDCSKTAAQSHLSGAVKQLRLISGEHYDKQLQRVARAHQHLTPEPDEVERRARWLARPIVVKKRLKLAMIVGAAITLIVGAAAVWWLSGR
jgi:Sigma-70, region 4